MSRPEKTVTQVIREMPTRAFRWIFLFSIVPWFFLDSQSGWPWWVGVFMGDSIIVLCALIAIRSRGASLLYELTQVRFVYPFRYWAVGFLASLCLANFSFNAMFRSHHFLWFLPLCDYRPTHHLTDVIFTVGSFTIVPIAEELSFRGLLARRTSFVSGRYGSIIYASLWFMAGHQQSNYLPTFMNAILWCLILRRTANVAVSMTHHAAWNFLCSLPFFITLFYPHYVGWQGVVPAALFELIRWGCLAVAIACYYYLFFYVGLWRMPRRRRRRHGRRQHSPHASSANRRDVSDEAGKGTKGSRRRVS